MEERGLKPITLTEKASRRRRPKRRADPPRRARARGSFQSKKVSSKDLENFTRLLSSLLAAGVPLSRALVVLVQGSQQSGRRCQVEGSP